MDNNIVKENFLEIIPNREIAVKDVNKELEIKEFNSELLPVIIKPQHVTLPILEKGFSRIKKTHKLRRQILKVMSAIGKSIAMVGGALKKALGVIANVARWSFMTSAKFVCLVAMSIVVVVSTTILTQNIINAQLRNAVS